MARSLKPTIPENSGPIIHLDGTPALFNQLLVDFCDALEPPKEGYERYQNNPTDFVINELGAFPWSKQREVLDAIAKPGARVTVRSCNGTGKTFLAGAITLWFVNCFKPCRVITTATKEEQLKNQLWAEIRNHHANSGLPGDCAALSLRLDNQQFAIGQVARDATGFHGHHSEHLLVICDEAAGIDEAIWEGVDAILTGADCRLLMIGNPTTSSGRFYDSHYSRRHLYTPIHIDAYGSPNFTGEEVPNSARKSLITKEWVDRQKEMWGEDSPAFRSRIRGEFPDQAEGSLIALSWIENARDVCPDFEEEDKIIMGVDIARSGSCENAVYIRRGRRVIHYDAWRGDDLMVTTGKLVRLGSDFEVNIMRIDATGMGAGVYDRLVEMRRDFRTGVEGAVPINFEVEGIIVGSAPKDKEHFALLRDQLWWNLKELLREGEIGPLECEVTRAQLSSIKVEQDSRGRNRIEGKPDLQKRGLPSPDRADALCLAFWTDTRNPLYTSQPSTVVFPETYFPSPSILRVDIPIGGFPQNDMNGLIIPNKMARISPQWWKKKNLQK